MQDQSETKAHEKPIDAKADTPTDVPPAPEAAKDTGEKSVPSASDVGKDDGEKEHHSTLTAVKAAASKVPRPGWYAIGGTLAVLLVLFATKTICFHRWSDATCTAPKTCDFCGRTEGAILGHAWVSASCTKPRHCTRCDETEGKALGHDWKDATCTEPKTCARCEMKEGKPLGHDVTEWAITKDATCTEAGERRGKCVRCGETLTETMEKLLHTAGDWEVAKDFSITSSGTVIPGKRVKRCTMCGMELDSEDYTTTLSIGQKNAMSAAQSYLNYSNFSYSGLVKQLEFEGYSHEDATFAVDHCGADWYAQAANMARRYLEYSSFSRDGLINQLVFEGFTYEQAEHGVSAVGY